MKKSTQNDTTQNDTTQNDAQRSVDTTVVDHLLAQRADETARHNQALLEQREKMENWRYRAGQLLKQRDDNWRRLKEITAERDALRVTLDEAEKGAERLQNELTDAEKLLDACEETVRQQHDLVARGKEASDRHREMATANVSLGTQVQELRRDLAAERRAVVALRADHASLSDELQLARAAVERLGTAQQEAEQVRAAIDAAMRRDVATWEKRTRDWEKERHAWEIRGREWSEERGDLVTRLAAVSKARDDLDGKLNLVETERDKLAAELQRARDKLTAITTDHDYAIDTWRKERAGLVDRIEDLLCQVDAHERRQTYGVESAAPPPTQTTQATGVALYITIEVQGGKQQN